MLYYFPLEPYKARYTVQLSGKLHDGWLESRWLENEIDYCRIEPDLKFADESIHSGEVLDGCKRGIWSCSQTVSFLNLIMNKRITSQDIIYFDDFWTPGIEALAYAFHQSDIKPRMYALLHAQSVDEFDFTFNMLPWIRGFEKGIADVLDGIFVSCKLLGDLVYKQGLAPKEKIYITGLPYNHNKVSDFIIKNTCYGLEKEKQVIYTSRFDKEKNPMFFLDLAFKFKDINPTIKFVMTTSHNTIKSNDKMFLDNYEWYLQQCPNLKILTGLTKIQYYEELLKSHIQFNCADQDFISWTLLEAITCGCIPLYPNYRSFTDLIPHLNKYRHKNTQSAIDNLNYLLETKLENLHTRKQLNSIVDFHNYAWKRMWEIMNGKNYVEYYNLKCFNKDFFNAT